MTLVKADGTQITKAAMEGLVEPVPEADPRVRITEAVYEVSTPSGTRYPPIIRQLRFHAGQIVPRREVDAEFATATIATVTPNTGPAAGGTTVVIRGSGFTPDSTAALGGNALTDVTVVNDGEMRGTTPAGTAGAVDVTVTTDAGTATRTGAFTYA